MEKNSTEFFVPLSKRLLSIASFVQKDKRLLDVGCDHAYIPIYLIKNNIISHAIASDVRKEPLLRAQKHIEIAGCSNKIETRLSDGLKSINKDEADTILIAGMGGDLITRILEEGKEVLTSSTDIILSPHTKWAVVRRWLLANGYKTVKEEMISEDGKYYLTMRAIKGMEITNNESTLKRLCNEHFGRLLIGQKDRVLASYLERESDLTKRNMKYIESGDNNKRKEDRIKEMNKYLELIKEARNEMQ